MAEEKIIELREQDMIDIIWGATLMGAGGGGSISSGIKLMESYKERHPGEELLVKMIDASDMKVGEYASATAGMGAPAAIVGVDFSAYAANAANLLKEIAGCVGGGGGGRPNMAQAGGKDPSGIPNAIEKSKEVLKNQIS